MAALTAGQVVYGAPRTLLFVTVKRDNPSWRDLYGHWWVEVGQESYGWWPRAVPIGLRQLLTGTEGVLNGVGLLGRSGTWHRDAQHGQRAAHEFHPVLGLALSDDEVRVRIRTFAHGYRGGWRWAWTPRSEHDTCRSFQDELLRAAGLEEGIEQLASRGEGCPFLYRPRTVLWWWQDRFEASRSRCPLVGSQSRLWALIGGEAELWSRSSADCTLASSACSRGLRFLGLDARRIPRTHHTMTATMANQ